MATADNFAAAVQKILEDYKDGIIVGTDELVKKLSQKGAKQVKSNSNFGTGAYAKGWKSKVEKTRLSTTGIIYNEKSGLPHLLENGHALRNGGRVAGRTHIAPVEEELVKEFEQAVKDLI